MKLAIVIPYYKLIFFNETLQSLVNQTDKRFKVYIGDDDSPEDPTGLLEYYKDKFEFSYYKFKNNLGSRSLVKHWERCIALTNKEEWLMILGDDDVLSKNVVEEFYKSLPEIKNEKISVIRLSTCKINEFGKSISQAYKHPKIEKAVEFLFNKTRSSLSEYIFSKPQVKTIGFKNFPLAWFSDVLAVLEFSNFKNIFSINNTLVKIRISNLSISGNQGNLVLKEKAKFEFYYYLLSRKKQHFTILEQKELFLRLNKCYLNDKKNMSMFFKISSIYFFKFLIKEYFSFIKAICLSINNDKI
jgi:hypothetical protein